MNGMVIANMIKARRGRSDVCFKVEDGAPESSSPLIIRRLLCGPEPTSLGQDFNLVIF